MKRAIGLSLILVPAVIFLPGCRSPMAKGRVVMPPRAPAPIVAPSSTARVAPSMVQVPAAPQPAVNPKQLKQEQQGVEARIDHLDRFTAEQKKIQARLNNEIHNLQRQLAALQAQVQQVEGRATETAKKITDGETAIANLKSDLARVSGSAPAPVADPKLADQKRQAETQQAILQQREAEIRDLHAALATRDAMLKDQFRGLSAKPAAPAASVAVSPPASRSEPRVLPVAVPQTAPGDSSMSTIQMVAEGNRLLRDGNPVAAEKMFSMALVKDPFLVGARFGLASCRYTRGDFAEAKRLVDEVIKIESRNAEALGLAGIIAWKQNNLKLATALLGRAIKQDPKNAQWHNYMGIIWDAQGKRSHAIGEFEKAVALNPNLTEAHFNLAVILATEDRPQMEKARQHYQSSLRLGNARDEKLEGILYQ